MKFVCTILVDPVSNFMITLEKTAQKNIETGGIEEICGGIPRSITGTSLHRKKQTSLQREGKKAVITTTICHP